MPTLEIDSAKDFFAKKGTLLGIHAIKKDFDTFDDFTFETEKSFRVKKTIVSCIGNTPAFDVAIWFKKVLPIHKRLR